MFSRSKSQYHNVSEDPVHIIWVTKLRVFAGLLHSTSNISSNAKISSTRKNAAALEIDFLHFTRSLSPLLSNVALYKLQKHMIHRTLQVHHRASDSQ
jgi:hypothetical protein